MSDNGSNRQNATDEATATGGGQRATRRSVMKGMAGAAAAGIAFAGSASASHGVRVPDRIADTFDTVVDVTDAGADDTGQESITGVLERSRDDDTLLYFPPGRYYMDEQFRYTGFDNFGLYGNDATLVPANYYDIADGKHKLFRLGTHYAPGNRLVVENFTVDSTAENTGVRAFEAAIARDLQIRDITVEGRHDSGMWGPGRFVVRDPEGSGVVERFRAPGGGAFSADTPSAGTLWRGPSGIICNDYNRGNVTFRDCELGGFPDNGLYCGGSEGPIRVEGGVYENSNGNNVRIGGPDAVISGVTVRVDETEAEANHHRGIRLQGTTDALIEDTSVHIDVPVYGSTGIVVMADCEGETTVRDSRIESHGAKFNNGIDASAGSGRLKIYRTEIDQATPGGSAVLLGGNGTDDEWAMLAQVTITGSPGHKWNRSAIYNERNNVEFRAVTIDQYGGSKRRGLTNYGDDCTVYECDFRVNQYPVIDGSSGTWASYNRFESRDGFEGYFLTDDAEDAYLKRNVIDDGIRDDGAEGLRLYDNS